MELSEPEHNPTRMDIGAAFASQNGLLALSLFFGSFVNILVFTGPIFALQIYDRVLGSRSKETLVALSLLMVFLFVVMGVLDHVRKRIAARIGERMITELERPVFESLSAQAAPARTADKIRDLEILRYFFTSPIFVALGDLLWLPVFILGLAILHPALGWLCLLGSATFLVLGIWNLMISDSGRPEDQSGYHKAAALARIAEHRGDKSHGISQMGGVYPQWQSLRQRARKRALKAQDRRAGMTSTAQTFRMLLQSTTIALGAFLVLRNQLTPGAIIASTVLLARALGPLDMISQNTLALRNMYSAWQRLSKVVGPKAIPNVKDRVVTAELRVDQLTVFPPNQRKAALRMIEFELVPGSAIGVTGPSGAGKSTLARTISGIWPAAGGSLKVGGLPIGHLNQNSRNCGIGYLPQSIGFFPGTLGQNISGFEPGKQTKKIETAAKATGAHEFITALPEGYETVINPNTPPFSGGLTQRIALARAIYQNPPLLVLDEPTNNLDQDGIDMFNEIILCTKNSGRSAIVMSQQSAVLIGCDQILVLMDGIQQYIGPPKGASAGAGHAHRWGRAIPILGHGP